MILLGPLLEKGLSSYRWIWQNVNIFNYCIFAAGNTRVTLKDDQSGEYEWKFETACSSPRNFARFYGKTYCSHCMKRDTSLSALVQQLNCQHSSETWIIYNTSPPWDWSSSMLIRGLPAVAHEVTENDSSMNEVLVQWWYVLLIE